MRRAATGICAVLSVSAAARADAESCVAAAEEGQKLRDEGHMVRARERLTECAREECPAPVRADCVRFVEDVERRTPTIVVGARDRGKDTTEVAVSIDGALRSSRLDGRPIALDPGEHRIRYEHVGDTAIEETFVLREGERERPMRVQFGAVPVVVLPPRNPPVLGYAMTGLSVVALAGFVILAVTGYSTYEVCKNEGASCDVPSHQSQSLAEFVSADVSLGIALVAAGIATWAFIRHGAHHPNAAGLRSVYPLVVAF